MYVCVCVCVLCVYVGSHGLHLRRYHVSFTTVIGLFYYCDRASFTTAIGLVYYCICAATTSLLLQ